MRRKFLFSIYYFFSFDNVLVLRQSRNQMSGNIGQDIAPRTLAPQELALRTLSPQELASQELAPQELASQELPLKNSPFGPPPSDYSRPGLLLALLQLAVQGRDDSLCLLYLKVGTLGNLLGSKGYNSLCAVKTYG